MAGVTDNCRECGFPIFDDQTRTMLCDACFKLPPEQRLSGIRKQQEDEKEARRIATIQRARDDYDRQLAEHRNGSARIDNQLRQSRPLTSGNTRMLSELLEEVKELRRMLNASEIHDDKVPEVKSFLRKFNNLDLEGE